MTTTDRSMFARARLTFSRAALVVSRTTRALAGTALVLTGRRRARTDGSLVVSVRRHEVSGRRPAARGHRRAARVHRPGLPGDVHAVRAAGHDLFGRRPALHTRRRGVNDGRHKLPGARHERDSGSPGPHADRDARHGRRRKTTAPRHAMIGLRPVLHALRQTLWVSRQLLFADVRVLPGLRLTLHAGRFASHAERLEPLADRYVLLANRHPHRTGPRERRRAGSAHRARAPPAPSVGGHRRTQGFAFLMPYPRRHAGGATLIVQELQVMNRSHAQMLRVFTRIRDFLARTPITAQLGDLDGQRKQLDSIITRLTVACDDQRRLTRASRGGTLTAKRLARRVRHTFIRPVVRAAQTMTELDAVALRALSMPKMESYEQLVSATNEYARLVEQHRDRFVAAGLAPDIAEKMRGAAAEVLAVVNARSADQGQRVASSQGAYAASGAGRRLLRLLSALVESALEEEVALLAEWRSLVRLSGRGSAPADTTPTEVPAGSAPVVEGALQAA